MYRFVEAKMFRDPNREGVLYASLLILGVTLTGWALHNLVNSGDEVAKLANLISNGAASISH
jgi:hypothetical protein